MRDFIISLLTCSVTMSVLALLYMAVTPLLIKRYSVKGCYYTWLVIVIGLIIPFRPQFNNAIVKLSTTSESASIVQIGNGNPISIPIISDSALPSVLPAISWWHIVAVVWIAGMLSFIAYHGIRHYRFLKMTWRWSECVSDQHTLTVLQDLQAEMGIIKRVDTYVCSSIGSPMLIGYAKPRILLPNADLQHDELRFILKHELVHYKRKDLWYKTLVLIAAAVHWFNPVVYLVAKAIDRHCELSCDAAVVGNTDIDTRQYYSEAIIGVVRLQSNLKTALSTSFYGGKKGMKKRILSIMDTTKKRAGAGILCIALIATLGTGIAFAANAQTLDKQPQNKPITVEDNAPVATEEKRVSGAQELSMIEIGGTSLDFREDKVLRAASADAEKAFIEEITEQFSVDTVNLPMVTQFIKDSIYGDIWVMGTATKEYRYEVVIEYGTNAILQTYQIPQ